MGTLNSQRRADFSGKSTAVPGRGLESGDSHIFSSSTITKPLGDDGEVRQVHWSVCSSSPLFLLHLKQPIHRFPIPRRCCTRQFLPLLQPENQKKRSTLCFRFWHLSGLILLPPATQTDSSKDRGLRIRQRSDADRPNFGDIDSGRKRY